MNDKTTSTQADPKSLTQSLGEEFDSESFLNSLSGNTEAKTKETQPPPDDDEQVNENESQEEEAEEEADEPEEQDETESEEEDVLSQIDLDALDDKQKADLAIRLGSGAGKELSKLRRENREYEEKLTALQSKLEKQLGDIIPTNNPYGQIKDVEKLEKAVESDQKIKSYLFDLLTNQEPDYQDPDLQEGPKGYTINGQFYAKADVASELRQLDSKLSKASEQRRRLEKNSSLSTIKQEALENAQKYSWFSDEESKQAKQYKEIMSDADVKLLDDLVPSFAAKLPEIVAAYVDKGNKTTKKLKLPLKKPQPTGGTRSTGATGPDTRRNPLRADAAKRINDGEYEASDVVKAFF